MKLDKDTFFHIMGNLKAQFEHDRKCNEAFRVILHNDHISGYDTNGAVICALDLFKIVMDDKSDWIDYYVYELEFGEKYKPGKVKVNDKDFRLKTIKDLWRILQ